LSEPSPQRTPVLYQAALPRGRQFAANTPMRVHVRPSAKIIGRAWRHSGPRGKLAATRLKSDVQHDDHHSRAHRSGSRGKYATIAATSARGALA